VPNFWKHPFIVLGPPLWLITSFLDILFYGTGLVNILTRHLMHDVGWGPPYILTKRKQTDHGELGLCNLLPALEEKKEKVHVYKEVSMTER